jgi:hypothetical protein
MTLGSNISIATQRSLLLDEPSFPVYFAVVYWLTSKGGFYITLLDGPIGTFWISRTAANPTRTSAIVTGRQQTTGVIAEKDDNDDRIPVHLSRSSTTTLIDRINIQYRPR